MKHNFGAGPCILPQEVLKQAAEGILNFNNMGLSILEISHRSPEFEAVLAEAKSLVKELLNVNDSYEVLYLQGGASMQFAMLPANLLGDGESAAYLDTGIWANKAIKEAKIYGKTEVVASSKADNYTHIPKNYTVPAQAQYFHITSNNTIYGTQLHNLAIKSTVPLVADMSSDIFSRVFDASAFNLIYAGAQKNMGTAGCTMVLAKKDWVAKAKRSLPSMLNYQAQIDGESMYNTPPVFGIYVSLLTLRWLKAHGGVAGIEIINNKKAATLYAEIDRNSLFKGTCAVEDRSRMNVCFVTDNPELEKEFMDYAKKAELIGIKGHRSVGGFRASIYNGLPQSSVDHLINVMQEFERLKTHKGETAHQQV